MSEQTEIAVNGGKIVKWTDDTYEEHHKMCVSGDMFD